MGKANLDHPNCHAPTAEPHIDEAMTSFFDFEKLNNDFVKTLQQPKWSSILKAIVIAAKKTVILVPHSQQLPPIEFSREFILCHVAMKNPKKPTELVSMNGIILVDVASPEVRELYCLSGPASGQFDPNLTFESSQYRDCLTKFQSSPQSLIKSKAQILREGEILFTLGPNQKSLVSIILIGQPLTYEGCGWTKQDLERMNLEPGKKPEPPSLLESWFGTAQQLSLQPQNTNKTQKRKEKTSKNMTSFKELFWAKLKDPAVNHLSARLRNFIPEFLKSPPPADEQGKLVHGFIQILIDDMRANDLWKDASHEELDEVGYDCIEKYIMVKIYPLCFAPTPEDLQKDKALSQKIKQLSWVTPDHLDIHSFHRNTSRFSTAVTELRKMDIYKAPKDKMICLLNACKSLYYILNKASAQGHPAGADEFLPLLIYTVIRANPPRLCSNMTFIQAFRRPTSQITETGYYLTHLISTTMFIEDVDHSQLNVTEEEFARYCANTLKRVPELKKSSQGLFYWLMNTAPVEGGTTLSPKPAQEEELAHSGPTPENTPRGVREESGSSGQQSRRHLTNPGRTIRNLVSPASPPESRGDYSHDSYYASESDDHYDSRIFDSSGPPLRDDRAFYHQVQTDLDRRRFLNCNPQDLRLGDIPTLLHMFCDLVTENQFLREELEKIRD